MAAYTHVLGNRVMVTHSVFLLPYVANDYGLFLSDEDPKKGIWLEAGKALDYYMLRNGVNHFHILKNHIISIDFRPLFNTLTYVIVLFDLT